MNRSLLTALAIVSFASLPMVAHAEPVQEWRCSTDSLDDVQARARVEWARKCALTLNTGGAGSWFRSTRAFEMSGGTFVGAKEYQEINSNKAYSGNLNSFNVNYYYAYSLYQTTPLYTVTQETSGPTMAFYKWTHNAPRLRPLYPTFETSPVAGGGTQLFPHPTLASCQQYLDRNGTTPWTGNFYVVAYCEAPILGLTSGVSVTSQSGVAQGTRIYSLNVPAGTRQVIFETSGGTGDADLYVQQGTYPTATSYVCRPLRAGNGERCVVNNPASGIWYAMLQGWSNYSGVTVTGRLVP